MELKKLFAASAVASALVLAGCGGDINLNTGSDVETPAPAPTPTPTPTPDPGVELPGTYSETLSNEISNARGRTIDVRIIKGVITEDTVLTDDAYWALQGGVFVGGDKEDSAVLTIEPGAVVFGETGEDYLVVSRDSQIMAEGTATNPVIMTSKQDAKGEAIAAGQWGGLVILGNGISNKCPTDGTACALPVEGVEGGLSAAVFGGTDNEDNSGVLKYVVVKNAGYEISTDNELNGITFGAVGSGTTVEYVQVHNNADDGIEMFGGAVNFKNIVLTNIQDDSIDWDNGYQGKMQFVFAQHDKNSGEANRGIEGDNDGKAPTKTPMSSPTIANLTILPNNYDTDDKDSEGIYLREGTAGHFYNVAISGSTETGECLELEGIAEDSDGNLLFTSSPTVDNAVAEALTFQNSAITCSDEPFKNPGNVDDFDTADWFAGQDGNIVGENLLLATNGQPVDGSPLLGAGQDVSNTVDGFFDSVDFIGALDAENDWREGWAFGFGGGEVADPIETVSCPMGTVSITPADGSTLTCEITGTITEDMTLTAGAIYALDGQVFVGNDKADSATLTVEAGVTVFGRDEESVIVVSRDSMINAVGTATDPITFTSAAHVAGEEMAAGQWGGFVILGNAPSNKCPTDGTACALPVEGIEAGSGSSAVFGGDATDDNSGTLRYVRVMNAGFEISTDNELNGITFAGVGSGTTIDYLQVHNNADDGVEFFGGDVTLKHVVLTNIQDDNIDWDNGFVGKLQHVLIRQEPNGGEANRGIEADNDGKAPTKTRKSMPTLANVTVLANNYDTDDKDGEGLYFREGTAGHLYNFVVVGVPGDNDTGECLEIEGIAENADGSLLFDDSATVNNALSGDLDIRTSVISCSEPFKNPGNIDAATFTTEGWFLTADKGNSAVTDAADVVDGYVTIDETTPTDVNAIDSFFDTTDHIGAVGEDDWTAGWTVGLD